MEKKEDSAIKKALKEAEKIFGQPVTFKVRDNFGNLIEATEEDITNIEEEGNQISQRQISPSQGTSWKLSITSDSDGSTTTFRKTEGSNVSEESYYQPRIKTPEFEIKNRFEEIENIDEQSEKEKVDSKDGNKKQNFTQHQQILPKK